MRKIKRERQKNKALIQEQFYKILKYKWKFLKRNESYVLDCEKWSGRDRNSWHKNEIILGYKFRGNKSKIIFLRDSGFFSKELFVHYSKYSDEWSNLSTSKKEIETIRRSKLNPPTTPRIGTWYPYKEKWEINFPLNPYCKFVPFFVQIASKDIITEPFGSIRNDFYLQKGTTSIISVNWSMPVQYIELTFDKILKWKRDYLKYRGLIKVHRAPFKLYDNYLRIWDLYCKSKRKKSFFEIAKIVFPKDFKKENKRVMSLGKDSSNSDKVYKEVFWKTGNNELAYEKAYGTKDKETPNKTIQMVIDRFNATQALIDGGYKEIG